MSEYTTEKLAGRIARFTICAVGLTALGGCQDSATGPRIELRPMTSADVILIVSADQADAGEEVEVMFQLPELERGADVVFEATVTWDPASFEYVDTQRLRSWEVLDSDLESGRVRIQATHIDSLEDGWIALTFVALRAAETSGFAVDAVLGFGEFDG